MANLVIWYVVFVVEVPGYIWKLSKYSVQAAITTNMYISPGGFQGKKLWIF